MDRDYSGQYVDGRVSPEVTAQVLGGPRTRNLNGALEGLTGTHDKLITAAHVDGTDNK